MFQELKNLLETDHNRSDQTTGRILDCLRKIEHFKKIENYLGSQYLIAILPVLKPFILREGFTLINQNDHYVLVDGDIRSEDVEFGGNRPLLPGKVIDLRDNSNLKFVAFSDCNMVRINKGSGVHAIQQKKIFDLERQKKKKFAQYQRLIEMPHHQPKLELMRQNSFFSTLGDFDAYEFLVGSQLKEYNQAAPTHRFNEKVQKIGYVVSGKMRLVFEKSTSRREGGISWFLNEKDWIGLQQFLWHESFRSSGEVYSIGALIMWIPVDLFSSKYNPRTNNEAISQLISLTKTKKILFDRSFNTRKKKEQQIDDLNQKKKELSPELKQKINTMQVDEPKKKFHISRTKGQSQKKYEIPIPEAIIHRMKNLEDNPMLLPKIKEKTAFFPQEYSNIPIGTVHKKEMQRLQIAMGTYRQSESQPTIKLNPELLYKTIYDKISYRFSRRTVRSNPKSLMRQERSLVHYNRSIYNNFRVANQSGQISKNKTLTVSGI